MTTKKEIEICLNCFRPKCTNCLAHRTAKSVNETRGYQRKVAQFDYDNGDLINIFKTAKEAELETGVDRSAIINCCRGKADDAGGFLWQFYKGSGVLV